MPDRPLRRSPGMPAGLDRRPLRWLAAGALLVAAAWSLTQPGVARAQSSQDDAQPIPYPGPGGGRAARAPRPVTAAESRMIDAVVRIEAKAPRDAQSSESLGASRSGSGVVVGERMVLTIGYLLLEAEQVEVVTARGRKVPGSVAGYDHATGFGLVRTALPMDTPTLELGDSDGVAEKQKLLTVGQGETETTELFVVSRKPFTGSWEYMLDKPIFTFPPVNNWSGAALITEEGKLVGIGSLIVNDAASMQRGVPGNLFVPVNLVKPIMNDLMARGRRNGPAQPWLGMTTESVRGNLMVMRVSRDGPAETAGINPGDIIIGVGPDKVVDQADFYKRVWSLGPAGTTVPLRVLKSGDLREVTVKSVDRADVIRKPSGI